MPLKLIVGPPNSGRTGAILDGFRSAAGRDPVLVVPTSDDVERFEGELTGGGEAAIGASVGTFNELFRLGARAAPGPAVEPGAAREAGARGGLPPPPQAPGRLGRPPRLPGGARGADR